MGSIQALFFRAWNLPIPQVIRAAQTHSAEVLNFFQRRIQIGNQVVRVLDAD